MIPDEQLLALAVFSEAAGEIPDGKAAVARVVLNRRKRRYMSDGTIAGTVLWPNQFSGFWFDFVDGSYTRVCHSREDAAARAETLLAKAQAQTVWGACQNIASSVEDGAYIPNGDYPKMTDAAVLYLNPAILKQLPAWADPANMICTIGRHQFYSDPN